MAEEKNIFERFGEVSTGAFTDSDHVGDLLARLKGVALSDNRKGVKEFYVVPEIRDWFGDIQSPGLQKATLEYSSLTKIVDHNAIISAAKKQERYWEGDIVEGLRIFATLTMYGMLDEVGGIILYLKEKKDDADLCLEIRRRGDGVVILDIRKIVPIREFHQRYFVVRSRA